MKFRLKAYIVLLLIALTMSGQPAFAQEATLNGFDEYANKALRDWDVPGVAIAIIKNDKLVFARGYGVKKLGDPALVDERTIFAIGSASKAFTAASIAMLVDEGKVKWDDPATKHLPGFEMFDPYATREMTVRDLLCHRSGLERGDLLWYGSDYSRDEILSRVRHLKPTWSLRSSFGYQNLMYLAAGQVLPKLTGKSWDDFVRARIFAPLGMKVSSTSITALESQNNVATPHSRVKETVKVIPWRNIDNIAPAGSINSNVVEMAQWVRLQLGQGEYGGKRLLSSGAIKEMHMPQTIIRPEPPWTLMMPEAHFIAYGLGWFLHDYRGRKIVEHGGNIDGMSALVAMMPEENLGLVILTNLNGTMLPAALKNRIFDSYMGGAKRDWSAEMLKTFKSFEAQGREAEKKIEDSRVKSTSPSLALEKYAGTYKNDFYGEVKVEREDGKMVVRFGPAFTGDLEHWHYDTFQAQWRGPTPSKAYVMFGLNLQGEAEEVKLSLPGLGNYPFKRVPKETKAAVSLSEEALGKFAGKYESKAPPIEVSIEMIGGKLKAVVPGQPVYTLVPVSDTRFKIDGAPEGFFVQFELAGDKAKSVTIEQGAGPKLTLYLKQ